ncbi:L-dopachrome tautomerase-related protein [Zymomonas mobilis]|uniref:Major royal jelly protein n=1 Tax=Zymomonas mobilis subsp. pomaceae (strain ATCC 29192 / DSM 22645 / JCM 10191 / CCUG 17912 / NBRC 13757 / NCIMB 11200 / NRRL B-4491 / Barker I) TaxID=579138 RepID=F8EUZ5_ZYMMT|nr:L-dopachrome tautomerase-related protein [Zymomonas mobilis]AEI37283.1 major royal jelly protein [Zymomonas mobilis subsp. pomaceae ATCC 29192]MDX5948652.1 L-dopachrome tautomerase-related protein [Zymomonas mobilis subsp. pomaceae]GEB88457.1 gluconolaconase [Zymomonas mobilis subsp. pomaceae]
MKNLVTPKKVGQVEDTSKATAWLSRRAFIAASAMIAGVDVVQAQTPITGENGDQGYEPAGNLEIIADFYGPGPSGIVVTKTNRIFVGFPRHAINHRGATLGELVNGQVIPWPNADISLPSNKAAADRLVSIHGMTMDAQGMIWAIDDGKLAGHPIASGAAKILCFDPQNKTILHRILLHRPVLLPDSHMNDLSVDLTHGPQGTVYVTDSSFGHQPALIVVDIASGKQRRVLAKHYSTQAEPHFMAVVEGRPLVYSPDQKPRFVVGGIDGITISPDSSRLFYSPLTSRRLYSLPTSLLSDSKITEEQLAAAVIDEGEKGVADGLATDSSGRIYTTNFEHDAIFRRHTDGSFDLMVHDPRILSPDGIFCTDTHVYCTLGQWNRLAGFNGGKDMRRPPYHLIRFPINPLPPYNADGKLG